MEGKGQELLECLPGANQLWQGRWSQPCQLRPPTALAPPTLCQHPSESKLNRNPWASLVSIPLLRRASSTSSLTVESKQRTQNRQRLGLRLTQGLTNAPGFVRGQRGKTHQGHWVCKSCVGRTANPSLSFLVRGFMLPGLLQLSVSYTTQHLWNVIGWEELRTIYK